MVFSHCRRSSRRIWIRWNVRKQRTLSCIYSIGDTRYSKWEHIKYIHHTTTIDQLTSYIRWHRLSSFHSIHNYFLFVICVCVFFFISCISLVLIFDLILYLLPSTLYGCLSLLVAVCPCVSFHGSSTHSLFLFTWRHCDYLCKWYDHFENMFT